MTSGHRFLVAQGRGVAADRGAWDRPAASARPEAWPPRRPPRPGGWPRTEGRSAPIPVRARSPLPASLLRFQTTRRTSPQTLGSRCLAIHRPLPHRVQGAATNGPSGPSTFGQITRDQARPGPGRRWPPSLSASAPPPCARRGRGEARTGPAVPPTPPARPSLLGRWDRDTVGPDGATVECTGTIGKPGRPGLRARKGSRRGHRGLCGGSRISLGTSWVLVTRLERLGERLGFSEAVLGLLAALAADTPEITSAVTALVHHERAVGSGVVIGSNVFNLAALLGLGAVAAGRIALHRKVVALGGVVALWMAVVCVVSVAGLLRSRWASSSSSWCSCPMSFCWPPGPVDHRSRPSAALVGLVGVGRGRRGERTDRGHPPPAGDRRRRRGGRGRSGPDRGGQRRHGAGRLDGRP